MEADYVGLVQLFQEQLLILAFTLGQLTKTAR